MFLSPPPSPLPITDPPAPPDPSLRRNLSATCPLRLLNQLGGALRKQPLARDPRTGGLRRPGSGSRNFASRRGPVQRKIATQIVSEAVDLAQPENPASFRERLNAIEMR